MSHYFLFFTVKQSAVMLFLLLKIESIYFILFLQKQDIESQILYFQELLTQWERLLYINEEIKKKRLPGSFKTK